MDGASPSSVDVGGGGGGNLRGGGGNVSSGRGRGRIQPPNSSQQYPRRKPYNDYSNDTITEESISSSSSSLSRRSGKKPEQQFYIPKQQQNQRPPQRNKYHNGDNYNNFRGTSEPRNTSDVGGLQYVSALESRLDPNRPRDSRSVEPNFIMRDKKPPIGSAGRRNSANIDGNMGNERHRLPANIEALPPRLQKKYLQESGLPLSYLEDKMNTLNMDDGKFS